MCGHGGGGTRGKTLLFLQAGLSPPLPKSPPAFKSLLRSRQLSGGPTLRPTPGVPAHLLPSTGTLGCLTLRAGSSARAPPPHASWVPPQPLCPVCEAPFGDTVMTDERRKGKASRINDFPRECGIFASCPHSSAGRAEAQSAGTGRSGRLRDAATGLGLRFGAGREPPSSSSRVPLPAGG